MGVRLLSLAGARFAALQVAVAFVLLAGAISAAEIDCQEGEKRCSDCDYFPAPPAPFGVVTGEECEFGSWWPVQNFYGDGDEGDACAEAGVQCGQWLEL